MSYVDPWNKKLAKIRELRAENKPIWYRRDEFYNDGFVAEEDMPIPKWHVVADRAEVPERPGSYVWKASCGYKHRFNEILLDLPKLRLSGKPKIAEQCIKCRNKLAKAQAAINAHHVITKVGAMSEPQPTFTGTPDDWWEQAERIMESEANNRTLGNWYITQIRTAGNTRPGYRIMTPSKPANTDLIIAAQGPHNKESERVRLLIRGEAQTPAWMDSVVVVADTKVDGDIVRLPWIRKRSGRWQSMYDGRLNINDHAMAELSPNPATITEDLI